jgi:hypothetical protein
VRFHKHDDDRIVVHLLVELYARSAAEATEVLKEAARGMLAITSLAEESRPPAAGGGDQHGRRSVPWLGPRSGPDASRQLDRARGSIPSGGSAIIRAKANVCHRPMGRRCPTRAAGSRGGGLAGGASDCPSRYSSGGRADSHRDQSSMLLNSSGQRADTPLESMNTGRIFRLKRARHEQHPHSPLRRLQSSSRSR